MGKRGPPRTPTHVLAQRGSTLVPHRSDAEATPTKVESVEPPSWISDDARQYWAELEGILSTLGILHTEDRLALSLLCDQMMIYIKSRQILEQEGLIIEGRHGNPVKNPAEVQMQKAWAHVLKGCQEFGLTPSSRSGIAVKKPEKINGKARFFQ